MTRRVGFDELPRLVGVRLGDSNEILVDQDRIDRFADATDDHQWLHTDPSAAAQGPFGGTVAHGYLTLSLFTALFWSTVDVIGATSVINYGLNKVRFPAPVVVGSRIKMSVDLVAVESFPGGCQLTTRGTMTVPDQAKPVCVAEALLRCYGRASNERIPDKADSRTDHPLGGR